MATLLTTFGVTTTSTTAYALTDYTFTIGLNAPLNNGYSIRITLPSDIVTVNYPSLTCQINSVAYWCSRLNSTIGTTQNIIFIPITQTINTITNLQISGIYNPVGVGVSGSFSGSVWDNSGNEVESSSTTTVTITTTTTWSLILATTRNYSSTAATI